MAKTLQKDLKFAPGKMGEYAEFSVREGRNFAMTAFAMLDKKLDQKDLNLVLNLLDKKLDQNDLQMILNLLDKGR